MHPVANPGYRFVRWDTSQDVFGIVPPFNFLVPNFEPINGSEDEHITVRMDDDTTITAVFEWDPIKVVQLAQGELPEREIKEEDDPDTPDIREDVATISAAPAMPELRVSLNGGRADVEVQWRLEVAFDEDAQSIPDPVYESTLEGNSVWRLGTAQGATPWREFCGGTAHLAVNFCNAEAHFTFRIMGINPSYQAITEELGEDRYCAIAWHESAYRQFEGASEPDGGAIGNPLPCYDADGGYGLMQITDPLPEIQHLWDWRANARQGRFHFEEHCYQRSVRRLQYLNRSLNPIPDPQIQMTDEQHLMNAFTLYRHGEYYYRAVNQEGTTYTLEINDARRAYADARRQEMEDRPWLAEE